MKNLMRNFAVLATIASATAFAACDKGGDEPEPTTPVITITTQPAAPAAMTEGEITGALTVAATVTEGATPTYQWYTNTTATNTEGTKIDGATSASYTLPTDLEAGTYHYFAEVSATGATARRSNAVTVTVNAKEPAVIPPSEIDNEKLAGKWEATDNSLGVTSVELSADGYYIVAEEDTTTRADGGLQSHFGAYTVEGDVVTLTDYGTMTIVSLDGDKMAFTLTVGPAAPVALETQKAAEIASSEKTDLLCRTWVHIKAETNDEYDDEDITGLTCYFSKAGTYFICSPDGEPYLFGAWKWKSEADAVIYYSPEFPIEWSEENVVTLEKLTDTELVTYEAAGGFFWRDWFKPADI